MSFSSNTHTSRHGDEPTPITVSPSPVDILRDAARYLQRYGWIQGRYYAESHSPHPPACVLGAIGVIVNGDVTEQPIVGCVEVVDILNAYLDEDLGPDSVLEWNDQPYRTVDEVIAALNNAADQVERVTSM